MKFGKTSAKRGKSKGEEGYGQGKASIAFGDDVLLDEDALVEALLACLDTPDYEPPSLPAVAVELMNLSQRPSVEIDDVVRLLEQDSMIAGRILKIVQSPLYAGAVEITSLRESLMRIGLKTLNDIVMQIAMNLKVFRSADYADTMELLRRHCTMTANCARIVAKQSSFSGDSAFLAGLLHDVGIAGTLLALSERKGNRKTPPDLIAIWPAVHRVHARAGEIMVERWGLSEEIRTAVANHHQVLIKGQPHALAACVAIADELAHDHGFGVIPKLDAATGAMTEVERDCVASHTTVDRSLPKTLEHARSALEIDDAGMERLHEQVASLESEAS